MLTEGQAYTLILFAEFQLSEEQTDKPYSDSRSVLVMVDELE